MKLHILLLLIICLAAPFEERMTEIQNIPTRKGSWQIHGYYNSAEIFFLNPITF